MAEKTPWIALEYSQAHFDSKKHIAYYCREYVSRGGYRASITNDLVSNFKKRVNAPPTELEYKKKAIEQFANELIDFFSTIVTIDQIKHRSCMTWIPPSSAKDSPLYDNRVEQVVAKVCSYTGITSVELFTNRNTTNPAHLGGSRSPQDIANNLVWCGNNLLDNYSIVLIVDDVFTTGGHFVAMHNLIKGRYPNINVVGTIWAKTVWSTDG